MREGTERLIKTGQQHWRGRRAVSKRNNSIGRGREAVNNRRNKGGCKKTGATVLGSGRLLTTAETGLEGSEMMLAAGTTAFEGPGRLLTTRALLLTTLESVLEGRGTLTTETTVFHGPMRLC